MNGSDVGSFWEWRWSQGIELPPELKLEDAIPRPNPDMLDGEQAVDLTEFVQGERRICKVEWVPFARNPQILVANGKYVKLLQVHIPPQPGAPVPLPSLSTKPSSSRPRVKPRLPNEPAARVVHAFEPKVKTKQTFIEPTNPPNVHSVSLCADQETFLSASERYIHVWNINHQASWKIVDPEPDVPPLQPIDPFRIISCAKYHPTHSHLFAFALGGGETCLADHRLSAQVSSVTQFVDERSATPSPMQAISDISFANDGFSMATRDVLGLRLWDVRSPSAPVLSLNFNQDMKAALYPQFLLSPLAYEFECKFSHDSRLIMTGNFSDSVYVYDRHNNTTTFLSITPTAPSDPVSLNSLQMLTGQSSMQLHSLAMKREALNHPVLSLAYHPHLDVLGAPATGVVCLYAGSTDW